MPFSALQRVSMLTVRPTTGFLPRPPHSIRGFSLVEMGMVTLIIGVLASLAMPALKQAVLAARATSVTNDLRTFAGAFQAQAQQTGAYPPDVGIGIMPPLMVGSLGKTAWLRTTPIGGRYHWEYNRSFSGTRYRAAIGLRTQAQNRVTADRAQLTAIDRKIDDGNLATGNFFLGIGNEPFFVIER